MIILLYNLKKMNDNFINEQNYEYFDKNKMN